MAKNKAFDWDYFDFNKNKPQEFLNNPAKYIENNFRNLFGKEYNKENLINLVLEEWDDYTPPETFMQAKSMMKESGNLDNFYMDLEYRGITEKIALTEGHHDTQKRFIGRSYDEMIKKDMAELNYNVYRGSRTIDVSLQDSMMNLKFDNPEDFNILNNAIEFNNSTYGGWKAYDYGKKNERLIKDAPTFFDHYANNIKKEGGYTEHYISNYLNYIQKKAEEFGYNIDLQGIINERKVQAQAEKSFIHESYAMDREYRVKQDRINQIEEEMKKFKHGSPEYKALELERNNIEVSLRDWKGAHQTLELPPPREGAPMFEGGAVPSVIANNPEYGVNYDINKNTSSTVDNVQQQVQTASNTQSTGRQRHRGNKKRTTSNAFEDDLDVAIESRNTPWRYTRGENFWDKKHNRHYVYDGIYNGYGGRYVLYDREGNATVVDEEMMNGFSKYKGKNPLDLNRQVDYNIALADYEHFRKQDKIKYKNPDAYYTQLKNIMDKIDNYETEIGKSYKNFRGNKNYHKSREYVSDEVKAHFDKKNANQQQAREQAERQAEQQAREQAREQAEQQAREQAQREKEQREREQKEKEQQQAQEQQRKNINQNDPASWTDDDIRTMAEGDPDVANELIKQREQARQQQQQQQQQQQTEQQAEQQVDPNTEPKFATEEELNPENDPIKKNKSKTAAGGVDDSIKTFVDPSGFTDLDQFADLTDDEIQTYLKTLNNVDRQSAYDDIIQKRRLAKAQRVLSDPEKYLDEFFSIQPLDGPTGKYDPQGGWIPPSEDYKNLKGYSRPELDIEVDDSGKVILNKTGGTINVGDAKPKIKPRASQGDDIFGWLKKHKLGLGDAINVLFSIGSYNEARREGHGVVSSAARAAGQFVMGELTGFWGGLALQAAKAVPKMAIKGTELLYKENRKMNSAANSQVFGGVQFQDTQQLATMRQSGMEMAKMAQYNLQQTLMGNEASYLHR